jgi:Leucine-rich repeat (LRR) protein
MSVKLGRRELGWGNFNSTWQRVLMDHLGEENLGKEKIENIQFLSELDFNGYHVKSIRPVMCLPQLESLFMSQTEVKDPTPLQFLPNLKTLCASYSLIKDWRVLEKVPQLEVLDLSFPRFCRKIRLPRFEKMNNIRELYINGCNIKTMDGFSDLENLEKLSLNFNKIRPEDISRFSVRNSQCQIIA